MGIPSDDVDPEYTSQRCPRTACQHTERANRHKKRFKCRECGSRTMQIGKRRCALCRSGWTSSMELCRLSTPFHACER
nr:zinc ribbon domain-containing protein [Halapricum hydrolyticum]